MDSMDSASTSARAPATATATAKGKVGEGDGKGKVKINGKAKGKEKGKETAIRVRTSSDVELSDSPLSPRRTRWDLDPNRPKETAGAASSSSSSSSSSSLLSWKGRERVRGARLHDGDGDDGGDGWKEEEEEQSWRDMEDDVWDGHGRGGEGTPLDQTIDKIGMGQYQWSLLVLSGLGWAADNMWLQGVAIVLPRAQQHFSVSDQYVGLISSSTFAGMMIGAVFWGSYSDSFGRKDAFNGTLLVTTVFGCLAAFANSFPLLCILLFFLGTGVGGSMPTDGTLFLESLPKRKQYLLTALSFFFSIGAVLASIVGLILIPRYSCPELPAGGDSPPPPSCDVEKENGGWRYTLGALGLLTFVFLIGRVLFFRLHESPKYLVSSGRPAEARDVLRKIAAFNGQPLAVSLQDVRDEREEEDGHDGEDDAGQDRSSPSAPPALGLEPARLNSTSRLAGQFASKAYRSVPTEDEDESGPPAVQNVQNSDEGESDHSTFPPRAHRHAEIKTRSDNSLFARWLETLPERWRSPAEDILDRYRILFTPEWYRTTVLVWTIWTFVSLAYTMFNVFLPKFLEDRLGMTGGGRTEALQDVALYAVAGLPGSILGAYIVETPLGRTKSMSLATAVTGAGILLFSTVQRREAIVVASMGVSLSATVMYSVIYSYAPEVFATHVRGTACGTASALSRLAGILAPLLTGLLFSLSPSLPLWLSACTFAASAACAWLLPIETRGGTVGRGAGGVGDDGNGTGTGRSAGFAH